MIWLTIKRHILSTWDKRPQNFPKDHIQDQRMAGRAKQYGGSQRNSDAAGKLMMSEQFVVYCAINIGGDTKNKSIKTFQYSFSLQCSWALWKKGTLKVRCSASHPVLTQWEAIRETIPVVDHVSEEHSGCLHWRGQWLPSLMSTVAAFTDEARKGNPGCFAVSLRVNPSGRFVLKDNQAKEDHRQE